MAIETNRKFLRRVLSIEKSRLNQMTIAFYVILLLLGSQCFSQEPASDVIKNSLDMTLIKIEKGAFEMGGDRTREWTDDDELPSFQMQIRSLFWIQTTEVSRAMFEEFCSQTGYVTDLERERNRSGLGTIGTWRDDTLDQSTELPVVMVSYNDASAFCLWLTGVEGRHYCLPTEPEWEFACRAGSSTEFPGTSDFIQMCQDNCIGISDLASIRAANPVVRSKLWKCGSGRANAFGLFDMCGNAGEIVDGYHLDYSKGIVQPSTATLPPPTGISVRGGNCHSGPEHARCSSRMWIKRDSGNEWTGFRVILKNKGNN